VALNTINQIKPFKI